MVPDMGRDRTRQAPDLFSTAPFGEASPPATKHASSVQPRRHVLPKDLPNAVKHLDDEELDRLLAVALAEAKRRGTQSSPTDKPPPQVATGRSRGLVDAWAAERRSRCLQGWHHACTDCPTVRLIPIGRAEGAGDRCIGVRNHRLKLAAEASRASRLPAFFTDQGRWRSEPSERNAVIAPVHIAPPSNLHSRHEVLRCPSPVPAASGLYAWYFSDVPAIVPTVACLTLDGKTLLYIGIAPDSENKPNSSQSLLRRIQYHYRGNAEGSTLRRTLGVLLENKSGFPLRRVGSGKRITLTHAGERYLDEWMEKNAFVGWMVHPEPWVIERLLAARVFMSVEP